ncbi:hypothetical protein [Methanothrix harundinacea]|uniref:5-bromo-4-chloroindolyl phosphate hydrolysis protein n=1 Tax=Methanothrix harundinacea (strain 6Ac) TaxID=1110509 RepID=G7WPK4_METH6|nr:hypothetical protein [Methanothrix harundinacea]AET65205.1 hypothetical protein Mhar_1848 [Methanothrix harundinacea 6Ac]
MEREKQIKLLGLNLGIAAANIIVLPEVFVLGVAPATAFGIAFIFLSGAGLIYGNYRLLAEPDERGTPAQKIMTVEDYIDALKDRRELKTFEKTIDLMLDQIDRLQKKNKIIREILLQIFSSSEISYQKFDGVISEVERIFFMNMRSIINKLDAFDEEDYNFIRNKSNSGDFSEQFMDEKIEVYNKYITFVKEAAEDNEAILLKLDKLLLELSGLNSVESGQLEKMPGMVEIDNLIKQTTNYKN